MDSTYLPLLLASKVFATDDETEPLDRLRMQKGVFLLTQRGPAEWRETFGFTPYDWGPYSVGLSRAVGQLMSQGLLERRMSGGRRYAEYRATPAGEREVERITAQLHEVTQDFVRATRKFVNTRSFTRLLRDVYGAYPEYAVNSRFSG